MGNISVELAVVLSACLALRALIRSRREEISGFGSVSIANSRQQLYL